MMAAAFILMATAAFLGGFYSGLNSVKIPERNLPTCDAFNYTERLKKEYANFLNYDGTEQEDL